MVALVTGAASGLGRALALELSRRGVELELLDTDRAGLERVAAECGRSAGVHCTDVSSRDHMGAAAQTVHARHGGLDLLINNAGISISAPFEFSTPENFERVIEVNFLGIVNGCRSFLPLLRGRPSPQILNVASSFAWHGYPGKSAYAASKAAVRAFSESLRGELAGTVGVTALYPGPLATNIVNRGGAESEESRARENAFLAKRGLALDRVARETLDKLRGNPARILIGFDYRMGDLIARVSPALAGRLSIFAARRLRF
jgi:NAD(P)-dependent dehydrogenase (short-subunit alcohol dehydrogenase family)